MTKKKLWLIIVIDSALVLCALFYFLGTESSHDKAIVVAQKISSDQQATEPKLAPGAAQLENSGEIKQALEPQSNDLSVHDHENSSARIITPERDELGLSTHHTMKVGKDGYPSITSTDFTLMRVSQLPENGAEVKVVFADQIELTGTVLNSSVQESLSSIGVRFVTEHGTTMIMHLMFNSSGDIERGFILSPQDKYSYTINPTTANQVVMQAVERERILPNEEGFVPLANAPLFGASESTQSSTEGVLSAASSGPVAAPPILESRPGAMGVIFLDFDGHTTTNTYWNNFYNGGAPIVSAPAVLSDTQITEVWQRVSESYSPFTINVTTSLDVFRAADEANKIRVVISPTSSWFPNAGGVAFLSSWSWGKGAANLDADTPTYVFTSSLANHPKYIADATVHEVGHTLALDHDGRITPSEAYYYGQGVWATNMGAGYYKPIVQWSKGEYGSANNTEDDLAIMDTFGGVDIIADSVGNTINTASVLSFVGQQALQTSLIEIKDDIDVYSFSTSTGTTTISAESSWVGSDGVLNLRLRLYNSAGILQATASPDSSGSTANIDASLGAMTLSAGTYYVAVDGPGEGAANVSGFSTYGNIGSYKLTVIVPAVSGTATATATSTNTSIAATSTPTPQSTATSTPVSTATPQPTATSTQTSIATNTPEPPAIATNTPDPCEGGSCEINQPPIANTSQIRLNREGVAIFSFDAEDPDQSPSDGISSISIITEARFGTLAPVIQSDATTRLGADSDWSYSIAESSSESAIPLLYNRASRTFTRNGDSPSSSNQAVVSRKTLNLPEGSSFIAEKIVEQSGTVTIFPLVTISKQKKRAPGSEGLGVTIYVNGEQVNQRVDITKTNTSTPGVGAVSALVKKGDIIEVFLERIGSNSSLQFELFYASSAGDWRYESLGRKARAGDYFNYYVSDGEADSNIARVDVIPAKNANIIRRRQGVEAQLQSRLRAELLSMLKSP
jgi:hypothetical protein